ncbi:NUDIX domain-containing protein [Rhizobium etli]|nr:NUDIX domain-containing protein [Rhizobium etli]
MRRTGSTLSGEWCQIAGGIEHGETAWQAALREAKEETGCRFR